jgi:plastocyanin
LRAADIVGVVTFKGTPPPEIPLTQMEDNSDCMAMYTNTHDASLRRRAERRVWKRDVYLQGMDGKSTGASAPSAVLDQKGCLYTPTILAVQTGQKIVVKNSDQCIHNVHCIPTVPGNPEYNDPAAARRPGFDLHFSETGDVFQIQCDVHPWMFAWVSVFDHPYFCVSGTDGKFVIKNVPPGKYTIVAAHRKAGTQTRKWKLLTRT